MFSKVVLFTKFFVAVLPILCERLVLSIRAQIHHYTYKPGSDPRNIIIIGGSFGGQSLAVELAKRIPNGYRVVLIEKNSHFNFSWLFPRVSVVEGHEHKAFIPYHGGFAKLPAGSFHFIQACVVAVDEHAVTLQDGTRLEYTYLAVATGSTGVPPWHLATGEKRDGVEVFRGMQKAIRDAKDLVIVGGGAVGVELAADAKTKYPEKNVSLIHSRSTLLNSFGPKLHDYVMEEFRKLEINVHLGERAPEGVQNEKALDFTLKSGKVVTFDLLIRCTGAKPASSTLSGVSPSSISPSGTVLVKKTLQITDTNHPRIYAFGDVVETGGVRMGRAATFQASVVAANITRSIKGKPLKDYKIFSFLGGMIDLTLGLTKSVVYIRDNDKEFLIPRKKKIDLDAYEAWKLNGARPFEDKDYDMKLRA
ncbi:uncharacterized protein TRUGW13939_05106 [Talaromyces rugulosus]|uniref:FAD/NAD(P)-binding domain-containing protein n=1 Tax=Talaromyces rugulosus TaxID=121627 RepID=A0A7H8QVX9_TALRU|nr:uncharacterized protein TRUGW13939_05106 [Talaromyces rugulosus]QKX57986.1 hypothetical protein TRUGW13939_05106 [Talaromyces rugulosus]